MDLPDNVTMAPFSEQLYNDRSSDMASASYRQMNPHQNPYIQGNPRMDSIPLPEYNGRGNLPPPPMPPSYDYDQGPLGNAPKFSLPPKDIPLDTTGFRDESAVPNYVPPASNSREDYVHEQEERVREKTRSDEVKKAIDKKLDIVAELQMPIVVAVLFWIFQIETINRLMARYLKFAGLFGEDGTLNIWGITAKSVVFGSIYYAVKFAIDSIA
jgi:hypothetical protein